MKKTILLINPWIYDFAAYDFWNKPLGLLYIASFLQRNGYQVVLIDCLNPWDPLMRKAFFKQPHRRFASGHGNYFKEIIPKPEPLKGIPKNYHRYGITPQIFRRNLLSIPHPDIIFITSMMTYWYPGVFDVISIAKEMFPGIPVVLGGNYVSLCPHHAKQSGADFLISGEGEGKISELLEEIWNDQLLFVPENCRLDSYPYPAYDLLSHHDQLPILTSRGCPFNCTYCASSILNPSFRRRTPGNVFSEILYWHLQLGVRHFSLYDDAFLVNPEEMAIPLLEECVRSQLPISFHCPNGLHLRDINDATAKLLFKAGFKTIRFGFETSDFERQIVTGGKVTNQELINAIKSLRTAGYHEDEIGIYLLCGLPDQSAEEVNESILFIKSCGGKPVLAEYSPIPYTALWQEAVRVSPYNINEEPLFHNNSILPCRGPRFSYDMYRSLKILTRRIKSTLSG